MKTWLKGGLYGILVLIILVIIFGIILMIVGGGTCRVAGAGGTIRGCFMLPYAYLTFPTTYFGANWAHIFFAQASSGELVPTLASNLFFDVCYVGGFFLWFFAGAIIGLIIQKIKSKK